MTHRMNPTIHVSQQRIMLFSVIGLLATTVSAQSIHFDVSPVVDCQPVEDLQFTASVPGEVLMETRFQVSVLATELSGQVLQECLFHFFSPEAHTLVHDYFPKTVLVTDVVGPIHVQQNQEHGSGVQGKVGTSLEGVGSLDIGGSANRRQGHTIAYDRLPPMETLSAVGTLGRGTGVYFKQRRTSQSSLEGSREFALILRVPVGWSAGYLRMVCQARTLREKETGEGHLVASQSFLVPLYLAGDLEAKQRAIQLQAAEMHLVRTAQLQSEAIRRASHPSVVHEWSGLDPRVPGNWLSQIVRSPAADAPAPFERRLPEPVQTAIEAYRAAKRAIEERSNPLAGPPSSESSTHLAEAKS